MPWIGTKHPSQQQEHHGVLLEEALPKTERAIYQSSMVPLSISSPYSNPSHEGPSYEGQCHKTPHEIGCEQSSDWVIHPPAL